MTDHPDGLPGARAGNDPATRRKIRRAVAARNLARAANDTKWNELIDHFRRQPGWRPSYRTRWVNGRVSVWDVEWCYHLPFPFVGVEWFDIGLWEEIAPKNGLEVRTTVDHTAAIADVVRRIGFEFEVRADVLRIWGYLPKSYDDFPPA